MRDPTPELRAWPNIRERLVIALRWYGLSLVSAPFVLTLLYIFTTQVQGWMPGELPTVWLGCTPVLTGGIGSLPFFLLVPWFTSKLPWFDRGLPGVIALSGLLSIPAALAPLVVFHGLVPVTVWIAALGSIAAPRHIAKTLRPGALSANPQ